MMHALRVAYGALLALVHVLCSRRRKPARPPARRVAVVGAGIAGAGAAYSLTTGLGAEVTLFEAAETIGGNAKTVEWPDGVVTGLSVLAWPTRYFRNYRALLLRLGCATIGVNVRFWLRAADGADFALCLPCSKSAPHARSCTLVVLLD